MPAYSLVILTVLAVVLFSELPVRIEHFDHGCRDLIIIALNSPTVGEEFGDHTVVLPLAGCGVPFAEVQIPGVEGHDSLA
mgnify:CR=1 FL=1